MKCPICEKPVAKRAQNKAFPFCSTRCKSLDLSKWLNEDYRIGGGISDRDPSVGQEATNPPAERPEGQ